MTKKLKLYRVSDKRILDEVTLGSENLSYTTGKARNQIEAMARTVKVTPVRMFDIIYKDNWSNGYVGMKKMNEPKPGAAGRITEDLTG